MTSGQKELDQLTTPAGWEPHKSLQRRNGVQLYLTSRRFLSSVGIPLEVKPVLRKLGLHNPEIASEKIPGVALRAQFVF